ncbi:MAG: hypothetical protein AAF202_06415, partial [Pseudomonadota bacterium]
MPKLLLQVFALLLTSLTCSLSQAQVFMPLNVQVQFGGVETNMLYPYQGSPYPGRAVNTMSSDEGLIRIEFLNVSKAGEDYPAYMLSGTQFANIELLDNRKLRIEFETPFAYRYVVANDQTGSEQIREGVIERIEATISEENLPNFKKLYLGAPFSAYVESEDLEEIRQMAKAYRTEEPRQFTSFPGTEQLEGATLNGRPTLVSKLDFSKALSDSMPLVLYPTSVPLKVFVHPETNELIADSAVITGAPSLKTVVGLTGDIVGLDDNGTRTFGGPSGFQALSRFTQVDLQDPLIVDYVSARAEVIRMRMQIETAVKAQHGIPSFRTQVDPDALMGRRIEAFIADPNSD